MGPEEAFLFPDGAVNSSWFRVAPDPGDGHLSSDNIKGLWILPERVRSLSSFVISMHVAEPVVPSVRPVARRARHPFGYFGALGRGGAFWLFLIGAFCYTEPMFC